MTYEPKKWVDGEVITAEDMNHLEQGVANEQVGPQGPAGPKGDKGDPGVGVPTGGASGQVLAKRSATNYDTQWIDPPEGGGAAGVTSFKGRTGAVVPASGDYTATMVGALANAPISTIQVLTKEQFAALSSKSSTTLYLVKE